MNQVQYRDSWGSLRMGVSRRLLRWVLAGRDENALPAHVVPLGDEISSEMIVAGLHEGQLLQPLFQTFLKSLKAEFAGQLALDVGANIGNHSLFFSGFFKSVIAVEPNPRTLHILRANVALSGRNIRVLPVGFADHEASLEFFSNTQGNLGASGFAFASGPTTQASGVAVQCPVRRGDEALAELELQDAIGLIKLDVEGAELSALRGLEQTLRRHQPWVLFECLNIGDTGGSTFEFLRSLGYAHFYALESSVSSAAPGPASWLRRVWQGERVQMRELQAPEPGHAYLMILAVPAGKTLIA